MKYVATDGSWIYKSSNQHITKVNMHFIRYRVHVSGTYGIYDVQKLVKFRGWTYEYVQIFTAGVTVCRKIISWALTNARVTDRLLLLLSNVNRPENI